MLIRFVLSDCIWYTFPTLLSSQIDRWACAHRNPAYTVTSGFDTVDKEWVVVLKFRDEAHYTLFALTWNEFTIVRWPYQACELDRVLEDEKILRANFLTP